MTFFGEVVVTGTLSTFQSVNKWYSRIWLGMSCRCAVRFWNFHFIPKGLMRVEKRFYLSTVKFVTWTISTFSGVDNWYSRIWLSMSCKCAVRIRNFHFAPWGHMTFVFHIRLVTWFLFTFEVADKWYSRIWLGIFCRCATRFFEFLFSTLD